LKKYPMPMSMQKATPSFSVPPDFGILNPKAMRGRIALQKLSQNGNHVSAEFRNEMLWSAAPPRTAFSSRMLNQQQDRVGRQQDSLGTDDCPAAMRRSRALQVVPGGSSKTRVV
jgi:hypothetical protein